MSDGPHKSLPMRRGWKRVAEFSDLQAFSSNEVGRSIISAVAEDCLVEMRPEFLQDFCGMYSTLFQNQLEGELEGLRVCTGIERAVIDNAIQLAANGNVAIESAVDALSSALEDRAAKGARQVEEHYRRESTQPRSSKVRERIEEAIGVAKPNFKELARKMLRLDNSAPSGFQRQQGVDDGVRL